MCRLTPVVRRHITLTFASKTDLILEILGRPLPRGERGWGRGNAIRQEWCGPQRSEDTVMSNGVVS